jgi:ketosteroid isomerase-like protein
MSESQKKEEILKLAAELDKDLEKKDIPKLMSYFSEDCEIELLGIKMKSHIGVRKWLEWFFELFETIQFEPIVIMVEGDIFFEEFLIHGISKNQKKISVKISEVLEYKNYKIKSLRLYLDRLLFADAALTGVLSKRIVNLIKRKSLVGLI